MFKELNDLEFALLYRALNTERNTISKYGPGTRYMKERPLDNFTEQLIAIDHMLEEYDKEAKRRYEERNVQKSR